ncbi:MAG: hypothetical protein EOO91_02560 [Pedobacter sp.]|nr:MAG: hypothetical protein EOO91_02560 [Pedobacter sp.]
MENLDHILLFKTDIKTEDCKAKLQSVLDSHSAIAKWNVALDDADFVLRIVSETLNHQQVIELINNHGHLCCELT